MSARVLIAEDEEAIRALLREYLASDSTFKIVAESWRNNIGRTLY
jgi:DNA-binding NarL/FixJ family response regulator